MGSFCGITQLSVLEEKILYLIPLINPSVETMTILYMPSENQFFKLVQNETEKNNGLF